MRRIIIFIISVVFLSLMSCSKRDTVEEPTKPIEPTKPTATTKPSEALTTPTNAILGENDIKLTDEDKDKLGILIKWIYNSNIIYSEEDGLVLQLSDEIELLPTDQDKINFVINMVVFEHMIGSLAADGMLYTFTAEEADALIYAAVGDKFDEHKASEYISDYTDGTYSYSMVGGDGATWWPYIEIDRVTLISENEIQVEGVLKSEHDAYAEVYSYDFEAVAIRNSDSPFGGFTLKELSVY
jgi:hypothetical protein